MCRIIPKFSKLRILFIYLVPEDKIISEPAFDVI